MECHVLDKTRHVEVGNVTSRIPSSRAGSHPEIIHHARFALYPSTASQVRCRAQGIMWECGIPAARIRMSATLGRAPLIRPVPRPRRQTNGPCDPASIPAPRRQALATERGRRRAASGHPAGEPRARLSPERDERGGERQADDPDRTALSRAILSGPPGPGVGFTKGREAGCCWSGRKQEEGDEGRLRGCGGSCGPRTPCQPGGRVRRETPRGPFATISISNTGTRLLAALPPGGRILPAANNHATTPSDPHLNLAACWSKKRGSPQSSQERESPVNPGRFITLE